MLTFLNIRNLAIADNISIEFKNGFNVMTGETGAGKSIIVDSVALLAGGRAYRELIRTGEEKAVVEGVFEQTGPELQNILNDMGVDIDTEDLTVKRIIHKNGKNRVLVNGQLITSGQLEIIGKFLVQIHSQNDQQLLMSPENHLGFLDDFGSNRDRLSQLQSLSADALKLKQEYKALQLSEHEKNQQIDMLNHQIREIEVLSLKPGEIEDLYYQKEFLKNTDKIKKLVSESSDLFEGETNLYDQLNRLLSLVSGAARFKDSMSVFEEDIKRILSAAGEIENAFSEMAMGLDEESMDIDQLENRLYAIEKVQARYGETYEEIDTHLKQCRERLADLEELELKLKEKEDELMAAYRKYSGAADTLSQIRKKQAERFCDQLKQHLSELAMGDAEIQFPVMPALTNDITLDGVLRHPFCPSGIDTAELLISANPGETPKPLVKIASGGEVSRIMLSIKMMTRNNGTLATSVFDEVDSGIGGETAGLLASKLKDLSKGIQVICVSHLPQMAAAATAHFSIRKNVIAGRTKTMVQFLNGNERLTEIARMLSGNHSDTALNHAQELMEGFNA